MKLVLDTNVLVSAFFWDGNERSVLEDCIIVSGDSHLLDLKSFEGIQICRAADVP